LIFKAN